MLRITSVVVFTSLLVVLEIPAFGQAVGVVDLAANLANPLFAGPSGSCPTSWVCTGSPAPGFASYAPTATQYPGGSPFASSAFSPTVLGGSGTIRQNTSVSWIAGQTYVLNLWAGFPKTEPNGTTLVEGWAPTARLYLTTGTGDQVAAFDIPAPTRGSFRLNGITFTLPSNSPFVGKRVGVLIFVSAPSLFAANFAILPMPPVTGQAPVQLIGEDVALSVWDTDQSMIGVTLRIANIGSATAGNVAITSLAIQNGTVQGSAPLPLALGSIPADDDANLGLVVKVPKTDGTSYLLTVAGQYTDSGTTHNFSLNRSIAPQPRRIDLPSVEVGVVVKQNPSLEFHPPGPPPPAFVEPNAEPNFLIPPGPPRQNLSLIQNSIQAQAASQAIELSADTTVSSTLMNPPDPSAAATSGGVVIFTYNLGISWSSDGGLHFKNVDLLAPQPGGDPRRTTFFRNDVDGGLCCDQVVIYIPKRDLFVWVSQYWPVIGCITNCGTSAAQNGLIAPNRLRVAWATPANIVRDFWNAWQYVDLTANDQLGVPSHGLGLVNNDWLDYPDLAYTDTFLYVGVDHIVGSPGSPISRIVARLSLTDMTNPSLPSMGFAHTEFTGNGVVKSHFAQGAPGRMVLAALENASLLRVFSWRDIDAQPAPEQIVPIAPIAKANSNPDYSCKLPAGANGLDCTAPDGTDWYAPSWPGSIYGATYRQSATCTITFPVSPPCTELNDYLFAFAAGRNTDVDRGAPYVRIETLRLIQLPFGLEIFVPIARRDISSNVQAFGMASLAVGDSSVLGVSVASGGGLSLYPHFAVGFENNTGFVTVAHSSATQTRFGDYLFVRPIFGNTDSHVAGDFAVGTYDVNCVSGCRAVMHYNRFKVVGPIIQ